MTHLPACSIRRVRRSSARCPHSATRTSPTCASARRSVWSSTRPTRPRRAQVDEMCERLLANPVIERVRHRGARTDAQPMSARVAVVVFPGTNCELDVAWAVEELGGEAGPRVPHRDVARRRRRGRGPRRVRARRLPAHRRAIARFSPVMRAVAEFAAAGWSGRRHLQRVPGAHRGRAAPRRAPEERRAQVPVRHRRAAGSRPRARCSRRGRGRRGAAAPDQPLRRQLRLRRRDPRAPARRRPHRAALRDNPNGSLDDIAGICNEAGNVVGLMPHPERASDAILGSADGVVLLRSLLAHPRQPPDGLTSARWGSRPRVIPAFFSTSAVTPSSRHAA